ncbi:MAG: nucleotidyltransferase domain-containing protein [Candidatus Omnitrophica bacterium]|nr:nucleotidyltransferase domain-containing protein [Candidatus Omnitrophota bacterium]MDE2215292.1 nucleotidyltransferase domain-containing protein [Candidatus Omnitrophota bacterium]MDE2232336.1 nucleotidyltransferase domain-containing protein [Candidatus Omnitrophota bacterium]
MLQQDAERYVSDLSRSLDLDIGNLVRKLNQLEKEGILKSRLQGNQRYYSLNKNFPLLKEYKNIVLKTIGLEQVLKTALGRIPGIKKAVIFGSYASDKMDAHSDIDLLVVGAHGTVELQKAIAQVQKSIQRAINAVSMSLKEYSRKKGTDPFLKSVETKKNVKII